MATEIQIATVTPCGYCSGNGKIDWDICEKCNGTGQLIGKPLSIDELRKLIFPVEAYKVEHKEPIEYKEPKCKICNDTGSYHYGGSFGGGVTVVQCRCKEEGGFLKINEE